MPSMFEHRLFAPWVQRDWKQVSRALRCLRVFARVGIFQRIKSDKEREREREKLIPKRRYKGDPGQKVFHLLWNVISYTIDNLVNETFWRTIIIVEGNVPWPGFRARERKTRGIPMRAESSHLPSASYLSGCWSSGCRLETLVVDGSEIESIDRRLSKGASTRVFLT